MGLCHSQTADGYTCKSFILCKMIYLGTGGLHGGDGKSGSSGKDMWIVAKIMMCRVTVTSQFVDFA